MTQDKKLTILGRCDEGEPCTRIPCLDFDYDTINHRYHLQSEHLCKMYERYKERQKDNSHRKAIHIFETFKDRER